MKILITMYHIENYGGILNNQEGLYRGLRELGHEVEVRMLYWKDAIRTVRSSQRSRRQEPSAMGTEFDQELGWRWPERMRFAYKGKVNLDRWKKFASGFDLIIWQIPVPSANRGNFGNRDWLELYDVPVKQVVYVHDGNFRDGYPWLHAISKHLTGAIGVHPCAYHSLSQLGIPRAMAFSPQYQIEERTVRADAAPPANRDGWFSLQTFKGWKHVEDIVRAVPYMRTERKVLAGGGLQFSYMTTPDEAKVKQQYIVSRDYDPDCREEDVGKRIFALAQEHGMEWRSFLVNEERELALEGARVLIDPSWSHKYASMGDHFNRVVIDGTIGGCAIIARDLGIAHDETGVGEFFKPDVHYFCIPWDATPKSFAEITDWVVHLPTTRLRDMVERVRTELVPLFDYRKTAQAFVDIASGSPAGVYGRLETGVDAPELAAASKAALEGHFAGVTGAREEVE